MNGVAFGGTLRRVVAGERLDSDAAAQAFTAIMAGEISEPQVASFLTALVMREADRAEVLGAARAMRAAMRTIRAPAGAIDVCGTGGDGHSTLNVSTAVSFVVAACGVPVAKHGNRGISSKSGAADVLEALGAHIELEPEAAEVCLKETNLCFLFAPKYHPAMRHVANVRRQLGFRTLFNLLGPLCNPAQVRRQLMGVFSDAWREPLAHVLRELGTEKAWVVHGADGLDEISTTGRTHVSGFENPQSFARLDGRISDLGGGSSLDLHIEPEALGLTRASLAELRGGSASENACAMTEVLTGASGAFRDITLLNAAAALVIADKAAELSEGITRAAEAIDSGAARDALAGFVATTQKLGS